MALTAAPRGTGTNNTAATTTTFTPATNFAALSSAVLCISADNSASAGSSNNVNTVTDSLGNVWTKRISPLFDNGAASAGIQGAIFTTDCMKGALQTSTNIVVTYGASTTADTWALWEIIPDATTKRIKYVTGNVSTGATATAFTVTSTTVISGDIIIGVFCGEAGTAQTITGDSDTASGTWSTAQSSKIGTTTSGNVISSQYKVTTGSATQTFDTTINASTDGIMGWITLNQYAPVIDDIIGSGGIIITYGLKV